MKPPDGAAHDGSTYAEFAPGDEHEQREAAVAVRRHRQAVELDDLVESLTVRERYLIEQAWEAGARHVRDLLSSKLAFDGAVTVDAVYVRQTVAAWLRLDAFVRPEFKRMGDHYSPTLHGIVLRATRWAEEEAQRS